MSKQNQKRAEILGQSYGSACGQLRKQIMLNLLKELGRDLCYRCEEPIMNLKDLSIEHKESWMHEGGVVKFWDMDNIAFSHLNCNSAGAAKAQSVQTDGMSWCSRCEESKPVNRFYKDGRGERLQSWCKDCKNECRRASRRKRKVAGEAKRARLESDAG